MSDARMRELIDQASTAQTHAERLRRRSLRLTLVAAALAVALIAGGGVVIVTLIDQGDQLAASQKASNVSRVWTITQRCQLTGLIVRVLIRVRDTVDAPAFKASEQKCGRQLATVKQAARSMP